MRTAALAILLAACGVPPLVPIDDGGELGMNDVSLLLPLPADPAQPTLASIDGIVPQNLVASLVFANDIAPKNGLPIAYGDFQIVAVRFDVCDRAGAGPCPDDADGRLRLVLQPMYTAADGTFAHDIALHAF